MASLPLVDGDEVEHPNYKAQAEQPQGAARLIVLWLCWVVLALFLTAAGVVGFS